MSDILTKDELISLIEDRVGTKNGEEYKRGAYPYGEDGWMAQQSDASELEFLKYYHSNPHPLHIKRGLYHLQNSDLYKKDIDRMVEFSRGKLNEKGYNKLLEMKKTFDTPDEVFKEVMEESETFKQVGMRAPEREEYLYNTCKGIHFSTHKAKGNPDKLEKTFKEQFKKVPNNWIESANEVNVLLMGEYGTLAHYIRTMDYVNEKGLDGLVVDMHFPSIIRFDARGGEIEMRNFIYNDNREELEEKKPHAKKIDEMYINLLMEDGFSVSKEKEFINPVGERNSRFHILKEIKKKNFKFLETPPEIPE